MKPAFRAATWSRLPALVFCATAASTAVSQTWRADNGNGTFSNPLFYDEFSDPDLIRVGNDFCLTGTTMHTMPGLPVLHSRDLVNWEFMSYALDKLDLAPEYRLEGGKEIYGKGIWAPSFRYYKGTFHIFSNVNGQTTQHFSATSPKGPWTRTPMKRSLHDLSVLFDDDGKVYVVWGYQIHLAQLDSAPRHVPAASALFAKDAGMGEGSHFYKIDGKYYITMRGTPENENAARADHVDGPYEVNKEISADDVRTPRGTRVRGNGNARDRGDAAERRARPHVDASGRHRAHARGEWWAHDGRQLRGTAHRVVARDVEDGWYWPRGNLAARRACGKPKTTSPNRSMAPTCAAMRSPAPSSQTWSGTTFLTTRSGR